ncbi:MAG: DNA polymerase III subunit alpha, partial [Candidatus Omnitrophica bacterium]|nr:DNA polymerase III subunit alpha [Candidatus Omnitrophota bacterium]
MSDFVHLHVHSVFSLLSSVCRIKDLAQAAADHKMSAVALTDYGNLFGAVEFYEACRKSGVKPIIGCDIFVAPESRLERSTHGLPFASYPLVLLCENEQGYRNLVKLVSAGYLEGFYYRPRVDKELLRRHHEGLIALSGAISSEIPHLLNIGQTKRAQETIQEYREIFGPNNFYLEIQDSKLRDQDRLNREMVRFSRELDVPLVATANVFYMKPKEAEALEVIYCIQNQNTLQDEGRFRVQATENYFKSPEAMRRSFGELPESLENTVRIAERCNFEFDFKTVHLPYFATPEKMTPKAYLRRLTMEGAERRYGNFSDEVTRRIEHELTVIGNLGYDSYFLIVWDFVRFARDKGIPVGPGRGSAAGSVVSYCLGITSIDPLRYNLIFERFLNPDRISMPDIDIDFCYEKRDEVIRYVSDKYSQDNVAQIITFGTMMAKGVLRDVGRVMAMPYADVDRIAKLVPAELNITLAEALIQESRLSELVQADPGVRRLFEFAKAIEGMPRHASTHAAGVVISEQPLTESVPLFKTSDGQVSTMFPMSALEKLNILKMDFLGLRTLTVIDDTLKIIKRTRKTDLDLVNLKMEDALTFEELSKAHSIGVFQLESSGMRDILRKLRPDKFEDLIAVLALFRPGPIGSGMVDDFIRRKNGTTRIKYDHPKLEPILKDTYGIMVYQEQIMQIVSALAGFSLAEADSLRRAISKKKPEVIEMTKRQFVEGAEKNN